MLTPHTEVLSVQKQMGYLTFGKTIPSSSGKPVPSPYGFSQLSDSSFLTDEPRASREIARRPILFKDPGAGRLPKKSIKELNLTPFEHEQRRKRALAEQEKPKRSVLTALQLAAQPVSAPWRAKYQAEPAGSFHPGLDKAEPAGSFHLDLDKEENEENEDPNLSRATESSRRSTKYDCTGGSVTADEDDRDCGSRSSGSSSNEGSRESSFYTEGCGKESDGDDGETYIPNLTKEGYYTIPAIEELQQMTEDELAAVGGFVVGCTGQGDVRWSGNVDVRGLNLDDLVEFKGRSVTVFPDDASKPARGESLNRPATVRLLGVLPRGDAGRYAETIAKTTASFGGKLIRYSPVEGVWEFSVSHF